MTRPPGLTVGPRTLLARTCKQCGRFLPGDKFNPGSFGSHLGTCRSCCYAKKPRVRTAEYKARREPGRRAWVNATAAELRAVASRHGQQWTGPELELLSRDDGLSLTEKARLLGRSYWATQSMSGKLKRGEPTPTWLAGNPQ